MPPQKLFKKKIKNFKPKKKNIFFVFSFLKFKKNMFLLPFYGSILRNRRVIALGINLSMHRFVHHGAQNYFFSKFVPKSLNILSKDATTPFSKPQDDFEFLLNFEWCPSQNRGAGFYSLVQSSLDQCRLIQTSLVKSCQI